MKTQLPILCLILSLYVAHLEAEAAENHCRSFEPNPLDPDNLRWDSNTGAATIDITAMANSYPGET